MPVRCFTCGKVLCHLWEKYLQEARPKAGTDARMYAKIEMDPNSSKIEYVSSDGRSVTTTTEMFFQKNLITRYCCRRMFLAQPENLEFDMLHQSPQLARHVRS
jgi:DNA-directed RNA polymerase subunit N (RpoN/RPB10)